MKMNGRIFYKVCLIGLINGVLLGLIMKWVEMFSGKQVLEDVKLYTDWRPEIMTMYKRLAHEAPK